MTDERWTYAGRRAGSSGALTLNELRDRYGTMPTPQRAAMLANVLRHLGA